ncbi:hypothetical protein DFH11DRAFT_1687433 [Phellopilus nigrolimitatus]|nr:hypothetical protein DFH11DRAFT_1687433 [Phellopilus nigrolimitatus]
MTPMHLHHTSTRASSSPDRHSRSPSPPSLTFHPSIVPKPTGIIGSAASGAHYSGAKVQHRRSDVQRASFGYGRIGAARMLNAIFERSWRKDAVFEDPLAHCEGLNEIAPQPKVFSKSETVASRVLSSTHHPNRIIYSQTQEYTLRGIGTKRTVKSIVVIELDDDDKIVRLEDQRNGEESPTAWGVGTLRRLNGKFTPWLVRVPKGVRKSD